MKCSWDSFTKPVFKVEKANGKKQSAAVHLKKTHAFFLFWSAFLLISGRCDWKIESCVNFVNTLRVWENVKAQLWSDCYTDQWVTHFQRVMLVCVFVHLREKEQRVVSARRPVCRADAAIVISHSWRPRKCSVSWLTVSFSAYAWQIGADSLWRCSWSHLLPCSVETEVMLCCCPTLRVLPHWSPSKC